MVKLIGIALGAGVTSAALFAVVTTASPASVMLVGLAPLPVMIAGLGFTHRVGAAAALVGGGAVGLAMGPVAGAMFLAALGLPAWHLSRLALAGRSEAPPSGAGGSAPGWYPVPKLLLNLAALAAAPVLLAGGALIWRFGGYERALDTMASRITAMVPLDGMPDELTLPTALQLLPVFAAAGGVLMLAVNLYLAARSVQISDLLSRPWPNLPDALRLPRLAAALFAGLGAGAFLPGLSGLACAVAAAALGMVFAFEGLAAAHVLTRSLPARPAALAAVYIATAFLMPWPLLALALLGCIDCLVPALRRGSGIRITKTQRRQ